MNSVNSKLVKFKIKKCPHQFWISRRLPYCIYLDKFVESCVFTWFSGVCSSSLSISQPWFWSGVWAEQDVHHSDVFRERLGSGVPPTGCDFHPMLDRTAPERPAAVAGQSDHSDGQSVESNLFCFMITGSSIVAVSWLVQGIICGGICFLFRSSLKIWGNIGNQQLDLNM